MPGWNSEAMPDMSGRTAIVTGASSGIGAAAAEALAAHGGVVVLAVRNRARGDETRAGILARHPGADVSVELLDLADLSSVRGFASRILSGRPHTDILLNNAGLGLLPKRTLTMDGFETQFGTNHLGHFALTGLLLPSLLAAPAPRVVTISSVAHRMARIDFNDLQGEQRFNSGRLYAQSKLANLMFALALDRRAREAGAALASVAAHPGVPMTRFLTGTGIAALAVRPDNPFTHWLGLSPAQGALPGLYAATMPDVSGGQYWGPNGIGELRGAPAPARIARAAADRAAQERLWEVSEALTGVSYAGLR